MANSKSTMILGIESSCDETAASIIRVRGEAENVQPAHIEVLSSVVSSQSKIHAKYGGVVPEVAARKHVEAIIPGIQQAFQVSGFRFHDVSAIAVTCGPGLITSLRVGIEAAKIISYIWEKPLVPVNHIEGHIYSNWLEPVRKISNSKFLISNEGRINNIIFPALVLVVSGGHTELVLMKGHGDYKIIGKTRDDAAGEAFDKTAKILGLPYPGGPAISAEADQYNVIASPGTRAELGTGFHSAKQSHAATIEGSPRPDKIGTRDDGLVKLPRPMIDSPDFDFSFAGLKTAVLYLVRDLEKRGANIEELTPAIAHEFQSAAVDVLVAKAIRAAEKYKVKTVLLAGGVSANKKLRKDLGEAIGVMPGVQYVQPSLEYSTDNAAMIAAAGYFNYVKSPKKYRKMWKKVDVDPNLSL